MKTAIIFGSSGLIGNELFKTILLNNSYDKIKVFVRSIPLINNPKVEIIKTDFTNLEKYKDKILGNKPRLVIEAASSYSWHKYLNKKDLIVSIDTFGESGKAEDLFNFFGFKCR